MIELLTSVQGEAQAAAEAAKRKLSRTAVMETLLDILLDREKAKAKRCGTPASPNKSCAYVLRDSGYCGLKHCCTFSQ